MQRWSVNRRGKLHGPFSLAQIQALARAGKLMPDDLICPEAGGTPIRSKDLAGLFAAAATSTRSAEPAQTPASRTAPAPKPTPARKRFSLPKPVLFAICGTLGGLAAAIVLGFPVSLALAPAPQQLEARIRIAQPESLAVYLGDKNRFTVQLARDHWQGDVVLTVQPTVAGVKAEPVTVHEPDTEAQIEVTVAPAVAEGATACGLWRRGRARNPHRRLRACSNSKFSANRQACGSPCPTP